MFQNIFSIGNSIRFLVDRIDDKTRPTGCFLQNHSNVMPSKLGRSRSGSYVSVASSVMILLWCTKRVSSVRGNLEKICNNASHLCFKTAKNVVISGYLMCTILLQADALF